MAELGIPDPFDDDAGDWEGMGDPVHLEGMVWDGHQDTYADSSLFALLDHLDVEEGPAGQAQRQSSGGKTSGSKGTASDTSAPQNSSDDAQLALQRMEKIREKNRRAQARHREKVKTTVLEALQTNPQLPQACQGQRAETEIKIHQKQSELASLKAHRAVLQFANATAKKRNDKAAATLEATLHITTTILTQCMGSESAVGSHPVPIEASGRQNSDTCMTPTSPAPPQGHHCPNAHPSVASHAHSDPHAAPKPTGMPSNSSSSTQALVARAPRAALFIPDLEVSPPLSMHRHHAAISYQQLLEASSMATSQPADSPRACMPRAAWSWSESGQERLRDMLHSQRCAEAAARCCGVADVAWYAQMDMHVAPGRMLSFSSTLGSPPCCASFLLCFLLLSIEQCLSVEVMLKQGTSENLQGLHGVLDSGLGGTSKRQRGAHAALPFMPLQDATAELDEVPQWLQAYQDMDVSIETLTMRCGVYEVVPMREGVPHCLRDITRRYRGLLSARHVSTVLATVVLTECEVVRNIVDVIQGFLNETLAQPYSPELPNLSAYERTFFEDLLRHAACMLLLARREAAAIIADLRLEDGAEPVKTQLDTEAEAALQQRAAQVLWGWALGEALTLTDAPRCTMHLMYNTFSPFMAFFEVDNMHARLYKDMALSPEQRHRMAAYWRQWTRGRRHLDTLLATACDHLQCLPLHLDLPPPFLSHLQSLCQSADCTHGDHASSRAAGAADAAGCAPRFLGQRGDEMAEANGAMDVLRRMHMEDRDMHVDNLSLQMPGVFVNSVQAMRMWAEYMMFRVAPADFLALCQLAATQQHRQNLFRGCR